MIKKLRVKFIAIVMLSVFLIMTAILVTINVINYSYVLEEADARVDLLVKNEGKFPVAEEKKPFIDGEIFDIPDSMSRETPFNTRFFTVIVRSDNQVLMTDLSKIAAINEEKATKLAQKAIEKGKERGTLEVYRYRVATDKDGNTLVVFVDFSEQKTPMETFFYVSLAVMAGGLVLVFVFVLLISKRVLKPITDSYIRQRRFVTDAGHELKTPLTIISANNEIIEMETGRTESTEAIEKQVFRMADMVKNLTELAKLDEIETTSFQKFSLTDAFLDVSQAFDTMFAAKNKKFLVSADEDINYLGSESMIRRLFSLLLENAYKYSLTYAEATLKKNGKRTTLTVQNDAEGMREGNLEKCFERFYRSDEARGGSIEGSGIGLSTAREIIRIHHGSVSAQGTADGKFVITVVF